MFIQVRFHNLLLMVLDCLWVVWQCDAWHGNWSVLRIFVNFALLACCWPWILRAFCNLFVMQALEILKGDSFHQLFPFVFQFLFSIVCLFIPFQFYSISFKTIDIGELLQWEIVYDLLVILECSGSVPMFSLLTHITELLIQVLASPLRQPND